MRFFSLTCLIISAICIISSCSSQQNQILFQQRNVIDSVKIDSNFLTGYHIKPQDMLQIRNLQNISYINGGAASESTTSGNGSSTGETFQVEDSGNVILPVIGDVHVAGLTRQQAAKRIEDVYRANLLKNPIIEVKIINLKVTLLGEIRVQGNFPLVKDRTSLIEMIGEAGGLTEKANERNIEIIRGSQIKPTVITIDLNNINSLTNSSTMLQNGDIIYISKNKRSARADNLQNFSVIIQPALILFNTALIIFTLAHR